MRADPSAPERIRTVTVPLLRSAVGMTAMTWRRNLPVRIGVESGAGTVWSGLHAVDEILIDVDLDLQRIHVDDGADAGPREAAAGGDRRNDFAGLRGLDGDDAGKRRAHDGIVEIALGYFHASLSHLDIAALGGELRPQSIQGGLCIVHRRLTDEVAHDQALLSVIIALRICKVDLCFGKARPGIERWARDSFSAARIFVSSSLAMT